MIDYCKDCGLCCKKTIVEIRHVDVVREPKLLPVIRELDALIDDDDDQWTREYLLTQRKQCPMLCDNMCTIYPTRPNTCVMFEVGGQHCNELRQDAGLPRIEAMTF